MDPLAVLARVLDNRLWPTYRSKEHSKLGKLAQDAFARKTYDGYLSSVLITSQYCEDFARILLKEAQFTLEICLAMQGFGWKFPARHTGPKLDGLMFGQLLDLLDHSIEFERKEEFIAACKKLSGSRNKLAHELDRGVGLPEIELLATECNDLEEEIVNHFNYADDNFAYFYATVPADSSWDRLIADQLQNATGKEAAAVHEVRELLDRERTTNPMVQRMMEPHSANEDTYRD